MKNAILAYAATLIAIGASFYGYGGGKSFTALIPAIFGAIVLFLHMMERLRWTGHQLSRGLIGALSLLLCTFTFLGFLDFSHYLITGKEPANYRAALARSLSFVASLVFFFGSGILVSMVDSRRVFPNAPRKLPNEPAKRFD